MFEWGWVGSSFLLLPHTHISININSHNLWQKYFARSCGFFSVERSLLFATKAHNMFKWMILFFFSSSFCCLLSPRWIHTFHFSTLSFEKKKYIHSSSHMCFTSYTSLFWSFVSHIELHCIETFSRRKCWYGCGRFKH